MSRSCLDGGEVAMTDVILHCGPISFWKNFRVRVLLLGLAVAFISIGYVRYVSDLKEGYSTYSDKKFIALGIVLAVIILYAGFEQLFLRLYGIPSLVISKTGIAYRASLLKPRFFHWNNLGNFHLIELIKSQEVYNIRANIIGVVADKKAMRLGYLEINPRILNVDLYRLLDVLNERGVVRGVL